jgi:gluconate 2-dehydrogenase subunit 3-like protein
MGVQHIPGASGRTPGGQGDRFPGFDVLGQVETWDVVTAGVVLARLSPPPPLRFFTLAEEAIGRGLVDQLLDQRGEPRVPVLEVIDARLAEAQTDGWRYADMPEDGQAWRDSLHALDGDAGDRFGRRFPDLDWARQAELIDAVRQLGDRGWHGMPATRVWSLWTRYAATAFYAHPWAWNEIGFGGPAYPRGYRNLGLDRREPWEVPDAHPNRDPLSAAVAGGSRGHR